MSWYERLDKRSSVVGESTQVNTLLPGLQVPIRPGVVNMWGPSGSGKSRMIQAMIRHLLTSGHKVFQVLTEDEIDCMSFKGGSRTKAGGVFHFLDLTSDKPIPELLLQWIREASLESELWLGLHADVVFLDSITSVFQMKFSGDRPAETLIRNPITQFRQWAYSNEICVVGISQVRGTSWNRGPAGGWMLDHECYSVIELDVHYPPHIGFARELFGLDEHTHHVMRVRKNRRLAGDGGRETMATGGLMEIIYQNGKPVFSKTQRTHPDGV